MSSILEALKKFDRERAGQSDETVPIKIEILRAVDPLTDRRKRLPFGLLALIGVALAACFLVAGSVFWVFFWQPVPLHQPSGSHPGQPPVLSAPGAASAAATPSSSFREVVLADEPSSATGFNPLAKTGKKQSTESATSLVPVADKEFSPNTGEPKKTPHKAMETPQNKPPSLLLAGIAFEQGRNNSLAIINNRPVTEGDFILGAKVEKILPDRVRLSWRGKSIDLVLGAKRQ